MLGAERQRFGKFALPRVDCLTGAGVNQIKRDAVEGFQRQRQCGFGFGEIVQAAEKFQIGIIERLDTKRHARHARGAVIGKARGIGAGRIGFEGNLDIVGPWP